MFYRHFRSKDDLVSFCFIDIVSQMIAGIDDILAGRTLAEQLVCLFCEVVKCNRFLGKGGIKVFLNNMNPECDCSVSRNMIYQVTDRCIHQALACGFVLPDGRTSRGIADDLIILEKGIVFEWFGHDDTYDVLSEARILFTRVINSILSDG